MHILIPDRARRPVQLAALAVVMAAATWLLGWWGVGPVAAVAGWYWAASGRAGWSAALAGAIAWALLLLGDARGDHFSNLVHQVGAVFGMPAIVPLVLTLALAAILAGCAAAMVSGLRSSNR